MAGFEVDSESGNGMEPETEMPGRERVAPGALRAWGWLAGVLVGPLVAIWAVPWFVTQDGPAHVYNAWILRASLADASSVYERAYAVHWEPLPNWAGHLALMGLLEVLKPRDADRVVMSLTLVGLAASILGLRLRVEGGKSPALGGCWAALVAMNMTWLLGFYSFLMGACLFGWTLGFWWSRRDRLGLKSAAGLGGLLVLGYACHPISLGLTVVGLGVLAVVTPGPGVWRRVGWTVASGLVLVPLGLVYLHYMKAGGRMEPIWETLKNPFDLGDWAKQVTWVDPVTIAMKSALPGVGVRSRVFGLVAPASLGVLGVLGIYASGVFGRRGERRPWWSGENEKRGWVVLAVVLVVGGILSPDTLGPRHGFYLAQRVVLLGLVVVGTVLEVGNARWLGRVGVVLVGLGAVVQAGFVVEYGRVSDRLAGGLMRARGYVGREENLATVLLDWKGTFRANPLLHVDTMLGVGTGNVVWDNYEAAWYYFPVRVREDRGHPPVLGFEEVSIRDSEQDRERRARMWTEILEAHAGEIDRLVVWGRDAGIDAITASWFEPVHEEEGDLLRVLKRRSKPEGVGGRISRGGPR